MFLCVDCSDPAGHQDGARRAEMGRQSIRGRGEWERSFSFSFSFFRRDTASNLFSLLEDRVHLSWLVWKRWESRPTASEARCCSVLIRVVLFGRGAGEDQLGGGCILREFFFSPFFTAVPVPARIVEISFI